MLSREADRLLRQLDCGRCLEAGSDRSYGEGSRRATRQNAAIDLAVADSHGRPGRLLCLRVSARAVCGKRSIVTGHLTVFNVTHGSFKVTAADSIRRGALEMGQVFDPASFVVLQRLRRWGETWMAELSINPEC